MIRIRRKKSLVNDRPRESVRLAGVIALASLCLSANTVIALEPLDGTAREFLKSHCFRCHGSETQKGKFRLDNLSTDFSDPQVAKKWDEVVFRINAGEMPPPKEPQPTADELGRTATAQITVSD